MKIKLPFELGTIELFNANPQDIDKITQDITKAIKEFNVQYGGILSDENSPPYKLNSKLFFVDT